MADEEEAPANATAKSSAAKTPEVRVVAEQPQAPGTGVADEPEAGEKIEAKADSGRTAAEAAKPGQETGAAGEDMRGDEPVVAAEIAVDDSATLAAVTTEAEAAPVTPSDVSLSKSVAFTTRFDDCSALSDITPAALVSCSPGA